MNSSILKMRSLILTGVAIALPGMALAIQDIPEESGWSGDVILGAGYLDMKSNFVAGVKPTIDIGKESIDGINGSPESDSTIHVAATGEVRYTFGDRWQAFLGNAPEDILTLDGAAQLGIRKQLDNAGILQAGLLVTAGVVTETWEDPYQTTGNRNETDREANGIRLSWDKIFGSGAQVTLTARDVDIDTDNIGSEACTADPNGTVGGDVAGCLNLLQRDGDAVSVEVAYGFNLGEGHSLRPSLKLANNDRDGDAMSGDAYALSLTYNYVGESNRFVVTAIGGTSEFDEDNPLYGKKADADRVAVSGTWIRKLSVGDGGWSTFALVLWGEDDSDIDFHDTEIFQAVVGAGYRF